jgi:branched-subunit amino acid transport protein
VAGSLPSVGQLRVRTSPVTSIGFVHTLHVTLRHVVVAVLTFASVVWLAAIVTAGSILQEEAHHLRWRAAAAVYVAGSIVCHQRADRSFSTAGIRWPVCARCTGLYAGGAAGLLLWPLARRRWRGKSDTPQGSRSDHVRHMRHISFVLAAPTMLTLVSATLGLYDPPNFWRAVLALPLGALAGGLVTAVTLGDLR